jgi:hypothetical protein
VYFSYFFFIYLIWSIIYFIGCIFIQFSRSHFFLINGHVIQFLTPNVVCVFVGKIKDWWKLFFVSFNFLYVTIHKTHCNGNFFLFINRACKNHKNSNTSCSRAIFSHHSIYIFFSSRLFTLVAVILNNCYLSCVWSWSSNWLLLAYTYILQSSFISGSHKLCLCKLTFLSKWNACC